MIFVANFLNLFTGHFFFDNSFDSLSKVFITLSDRNGNIPSKTRFGHISLHQLQAGVD